MDFENYIPKTHPAKQVFKNNQIPVAAIAKALNLSYGYTVDILNGTRTATPEIDLRLNELASSLNDSKVKESESTPFLVIRIGVDGISNVTIQASNEDEQVAVQKIHGSIEDELEKISRKLQEMAA